MIFSPKLCVILKIYPRNINYMPAVKFFVCLDFERKSSFCKRLTFMVLSFRAMSEKSSPYAYEGGTLLYGNGVIAGHPHG